MSKHKLYCVSLVGYDGAIVSNQTTHLVAGNDKEAFEKGYNIFRNSYHDNKIRKYISCIELKNIDGHEINVV